MPILKPEIQNALRAAGLRGQQEASVVERLEAAGLGLDDALGRAADLIANSENDSVRRSMLSDVLRMHGALKEQPTTVPQVTIVIQDSRATSSINPILVPRELHGLAALEKVQ